jgi:dipeptidyl aminopeptidase/acylaminoacyl peptidase
MPAPARAGDSTAAGVLRRLRDAESGPIFDAAVSPDGLTVATATQEHGLVLWRANNGRRIARLAAEAAPLSVQYSADGSRLLTVYSDGTVRLWDARTHAVLNRMLVHPRGVRAAALSPSGRTVAGGGDNGAIHLAEAETGHVFRQLVPAAEPRGGVAGLGPPAVRTLAFSPDGNVLVSGHSHDAVAHVWDVHSGREIARLREDGNAVHAVVFSPDGATLATAADTGMEIKLWETATWQTRRALDCRGFPEHPHAFSADGRSLWTASNDAVWRWDLSTGRRLRQFTGEHRRRVTRVAAFPAGTTIVSAGEDGNAVVWDGTAMRLEQPRNERDADLRLEGPWGALAGEDAVAAYDAMWALAAVPDAAVPYLRNRLPRQEPVDAERVKRLLAELDHEQFTVRERATRELARLGDAAEPMLREHLETTTSPEAGQRIEILLDSVQLSVADADRLRAVRAIEVLERIGTPAARDALEEAFRGAPDSKLKERARATVWRLDRILSPTGPASFTPDPAGE